MTVDELRRHYDEVWLIDFEYSQPPGERPDVVCMVARELFTGRLLRLFRHDLDELNKPPFPNGDRTLVVCYFAVAEVSSYLSLGWEPPRHVLDLFTEFRNLTNGLHPKNGASLLGALLYFGLDAMEAEEKEKWRQLAIEGGPYTEEEEIGLLDYCQTDVDCMEPLLHAIAPHIHLGQALYRARYMVAVARMEHHGIPMDVEKLEQFRKHWEEIKLHVIVDIDRDFGVYEGTTFKLDRFAQYLIRNNLPWPLTPTGRLSTDQETFRTMAKSFPQIDPLRELRHSLGEMRLESIEIGSDHRNRLMLSPFGTVTSRHNPSNTRFVFGPAVWLRSLIQAPPGYAVAYIDWSQQELGIAAALSGDLALAEAYRAGDPYMAFGKQAGMIPQTGTRETHSNERALCKTCMLAVQYGQSEFGLAERLGKPLADARNLLRTHRELYADFWKFSERQIDLAMVRGWIETPFGWKIHSHSETKWRTLGNYPMQATGAECLRLAVCEMTERGISVCCTAHDAILIEAPSETVDDVVRDCQEIMAGAGRVVLDGFTLNTEATIYRHPDRYQDKDRGREMWDTVVGLIQDFTPSATGI